MGLKETWAFGPSTVRTLSDAFDEAWQSLQNSDPTLPTDGLANQTRDILARYIIEMAKLGGRDQHRLRDAAVAHLTKATVRKWREHPTGAKDGAK
jgi:hypothetical protein